MEDYDTVAFLNAFTRFSCDVGYSKKLLPDEGGQLLKGCESIGIDLKDLNYPSFLCKKIYILCLISSSCLSFLV